MKIVLSYEQINEAIARYVRGAGVVEGSNLDVHYELIPVPGGFQLRAFVEANDRPSQQPIDYLKAPQL